MGQNIIEADFSYSGWDILGNVAVMARGSGISILINLFLERH